jgi:diacylglycerol kinase
MESVMKQASFRDTVKTVLWGFLGIRRKADHERAAIRPVHVIIAAVLFVIAFILTLRFIVSIVVS